MCSCATTHYVGEEKPVIDQLTLVSPYSRIDLLRKNLQFEYSDSVSVMSEALIGRAIIETGVKIGKTITVVGRSNQEDLDRGYEWLATLSPYKLEEERLPGALHAFLSLNSSRYALLVYSEGFVWEEKPVSIDEEMISYESRIYLLVADALTGRIVYFDRSVPEEADPLNYKHLQRRINHLMEELNVGKES